MAAGRKAPGTGKIDPGTGNLIGNWRDYGTTKAEVEHEATEWMDRHGRELKSVNLYIELGDHENYLRAVQGATFTRETAYELLLATAS